MERPLNAKPSIQGSDDINRTSGCSPDLEPSTPPTFTVTKVIIFSLLMLFYFLKLKIVLNVELTIILGVRV